MIRSILLLFLLMVSGSVEAADGLSRCDNLGTKLSALLESPVEAALIPVPADRAFDPAPVGQKVCALSAEAIHLRPITYAAIVEPLWAALRKRGWRKVQEINSDTETGATWRKGREACFFYVTLVGAMVEGTPVPEAERQARLKAWCYRTQ